MDKRKEKWFPTKLKVRGNKKKAEAMSREILEQFEIPDEDKYIVTNVRTKVVQKATTLDDLQAEQIANLPYSDYLRMYVPLTKKEEKRLRKLHIQDM